jgi:hypothetical protein
MTYTGRSVQFVPLSPEQRVRVLRTATNLFGSEEPNSRLEPMLRSQGVDYRAIVDRTGPICLRRIYIEDGSGLFQFDDELGEPAFVMAVHAVNAETLIDLIAWPMMRPEAFATFFGYAGLLGGDAVVNPASFVECPCPIWATPVAWLQANLRGCVVLEPRLAAPVLRQASGSFQCEDVAQAQWLVDTGAIAVNALLVPSRRAVA